MGEALCSVDCDWPLLSAGFRSGDAGAVGAEIPGHDFQLFCVGGEAAGMALGLEQVGVFANHRKKWTGQGFTEV